MPAADPAAPQRSAAAIVKRSLAIAGHRTSISLEDAFWDGLRHIAEERKLSIAALVAEIDATRGREQSLLGHPRLRAEVARADLIRTELTKRKGSAGCVD